MYARVEAAGKARGMTLVEGKGNDPDTLGKRLVYVMDSNVFPFYQAEVCECPVRPLACRAFSTYLAHPTITPSCASCKQ